MSDEPRRVDPSDALAHIAGAKEVLGERPAPAPTPEPMDMAALRAERHRAAEVEFEDRWAAAIPERFREARVEDFDADPGLLGPLAEWADLPSGNLVLFGPVGTGKSHAAVAACRSSHEDHASVAFHPVTELLADLRPDGTPGAMEAALGVDLLIIDDLGAERSTDWTKEQLHLIVNRRWLEMRPTVATTNIGLDGMRAAVGEAVYSRLVGSGALVLRVTGEDRRRA